MKVLLAVLTSVLFFTACEFQQDPLSGASDNVKKNNPPAAEKPVKEEAYPTEALQIEFPTKVDGRVGSPIEFKIAGHMMMEGVDFKLMVDNLADFEGATFDEATGIFKWTPTKAFVGGQPSMEGYLRLTMYTVPTELVPKIAVRREHVTFVIANQYTKPVLMSITSQGNYPAGSDYTLDVTVEDIDAYSPSEVQIVAEECSSYYSKSASIFVYSDSFSATKTPNQYTTKIRLRLSSVDVPTGNYCLAYRAVSKHGVRSDLKKVEFGIAGKPKETRITLSPKFEVVAGTTVQKEFSIFDPSNNGAVSILSVDGLETKFPGSSLVCGPSSYKSQLDCVLNIVTTATMAARDHIVSIRTESVAPGVTPKAISRHDTRITVKAAN